MEFLAFASFAVLVVAWLVAPSRPIVTTSERLEHREAA
jgi:hypothetical protein